MRRREKKATTTKIRMFCHLNLLILVIVLTLSSPMLSADAFAFDLPVDGHRCFLEDVPSNVELRISYAAAPGYAQFLDTVISGPSQNVLLSDVARDHGTLHEFIADGGEVTVCFFSRLAQGVMRNDSMKRVVSVDIRLGNEKESYVALATKEKLRPIEVELRVMEETVRSIHLEHIYYKEKEAELRNTNESMTHNVTLFTVLIIVVFVLFSIWQVRHLKTYFRKKRLID